MNQIDPSMSLASPSAHYTLNNQQKIGAALSSIGLLILLVAFLNINLPSINLWLVAALSGIGVGTIIFASGSYGKVPAGIKNNGVWLRSLTNGGYWGWLAALIITIFYVFLYWVPEYLGLGGAGKDPIKGDYWVAGFLLTGFVVIVFWFPKVLGLKLKEATNKGLWGWVTGILVTGLYILLYWFPELLGLGGENTGNRGMVALFDPLSKALNGNPASQWFMYGALYTLAILAMGIKFIWKYRHNRYQIIRTLSVMFFQTGFAFLIPEFLAQLNSDLPFNDLKNMWPLNYYFFDDYNIRGFISAGNLGLFMIILGVAMIFLISPILTYFYGKRWYCSWVCGCGGLAETLGDPFRQLSDKSLNAWKVERWLIHSVLVFVVVMTAALVYGFFHNNPTGFWVTKEIFLAIVVITLSVIGILMWIKPNYVKGLSKKVKQITSVILALIILLTIVAYFTGNSNIFFINSYNLRYWYGFLIGAAFSGVIGVGFYPIMGSRVWCRFGCPMAAILGIQQRFFSRFRITTNGSQCISCGNCSTYCEMGIDVRSYAQKGQDIVRASCVGCGICAAVCPRGVLRLENGSKDISSRTDELRAIHISADEVKLLS